MRSLIIWCLLLGSDTMAMAQAGPSDTAVIGSLSEAFDRALKSNPTQAVYRQQILQARYNYKATKGAFYPNAAGTFSGTDNLHLAITPIPGELVGAPGTTTHAVSASDMENASVQYTASASSLSVLEKNLADLEHNLSLNLQNAQAQYDIQHQNKNYYDITAKADGIIFTLVKKVGDYVRIGDQIAEVGAGSPIIKLYIAEDDIQRVREGQLVLVSLNSNKDTVYSATITKVYPAFDGTQQAFTVEAGFRQVPPILINGTQLQGNIILEDKKDALVIPSYYLMTGDYVMIKGHKEKVWVKAGIRMLEWTEILSGITENDILIQPKNN